MNYSKPMYGYYCSLSLLLLEQISYAAFLVNDNVVKPFFQSCRGIIIILFNKITGKLDLLL